MWDSPNIAKFQVIQIKWKSCHKNTKRGCSRRKREEWCSYLCYSTKILSLCWPETALCSKEDTFVNHCLQNYVLQHPDNLKESPEAHEQHAPSCFWVWNKHRCSSNIPPHMTQLIYTLYCLPRRHWFDSNMLQKMLPMKRQFLCNLLLSPLKFQIVEVWSAIKTNEQRNYLVVHNLDNLNRQGSIINGVSDLNAQCAIILKENILK